jgi:hypothetical protein
MKEPLLRDDLRRHAVCGTERRWRVLAERDRPDQLGPAGDSRYLIPRLWRVSPADAEPEGGASGEPGNGF